MPANKDRPIIILSRGHSGSRALAKYLEKCGVYMGHKANLNKTYDSLSLEIDLQRKVVPYIRDNPLYQIDERTISLAKKCFEEHLKEYDGKSRWGFKTGAAIFLVDLYRLLYPDAQFVYLVRDGRDVILSGDGYFHLTNPYSRMKDENYFKIITFGWNCSTSDAPFKYPLELTKNDSLMQNRFWVQARNWREHVRMMRFYFNNGLPAHKLTYEWLCHDSASEVYKLFNYLEVGIPKKNDFVSETEQFFHTRSTGKYLQYQKYISSTGEDLPAIFKSMEPELKMEGYFKK